MLKDHLQRLGRRASVSVELALMSVFFLLPLFGGSTDMVEIISAQAQLNTAVQSLYYYALSNPTVASISTDTNPTVIATLMSSTFHKITFVSSSVSYVCIPTVTTNPTLTQTTPCPTTGSIVYTQQTWIAYHVSSMVFLPVPVPFVTSNPLTLTASGSVQIQ